MNRFAIPAAILSAAMLLSGAVQAMDIKQFDQMTAQDRQIFIDLLPIAAETVLWQENRVTDLSKVTHLFSDFSAGSDLTPGVTELEENLDNQRVRDAEQHIKNHDAPRLQVESALVLTLLQNGIPTTPDFVREIMRLTKTFRPH
ncbi:MAG TPA: hypothetical protein VFW28_14165 [Micropepsaceae bacterium]|nr:hypothetical protein [Micropepsaceae bacterium]